MAEEAVAAERPEEEARPSTEGTLAHQILYGSSADVKLRAQEWASLCSRDLERALFTVLDLILVLAGLPGAVVVEDLEAEPTALVARLPDWVKERNLDPTIYPLLPNFRQSRRSISNFEKFLGIGIGEQNGAALLDSRLVASLSSWLLALPRAQIRSVRHTATVAAMAVAEALGHQCQALSKSHAVLARQLQQRSATSDAISRQEAQLKRDVAATAQHQKEMSRARNQILELIVPQRSRDISEVIRLYILSAVDRLMKMDPDMFLQSKWTARVFLMVHDPTAEVRLKALSVITQWYAPTNKLSAAAKEHLEQFTRSSLAHIVERAADIDPRVAASAVRCLRQQVLADMMEDKQFDSIVMLVIGSRDMIVREEAALFINQHVFENPGICSKDKRRRGERGERGEDGQQDARGGEADDAEDVWEGGDAVRELHNSETAISMLLEFLENYMPKELRITERVVGAFWPRSPPLAHWSTMMNLCLVGEGSQRVGTEPIGSGKRLALLYVIEAAVRRADEDARAARPSDREATALRMNEACYHFIPQMPQLMDVCRPEAEQFLLLSHVCKILVEYAVDNAQNQVLVNSTAVCKGLRRAIEDPSAPLETVKNCADSLLALARNFEEAKNTFLDLAKSVHNRCADLLQDDLNLQELRPVVGRFLMLCNRGIDMSFGSTALLQRQLQLLIARVNWFKERRAAVERGEIKDEPATPEPGGARAGGPPSKRRRVEGRPEEVPDVRLALQLLECVVISVMWHVRMAFWVETQGTSPEERAAAEQEVKKMLHGFSELPLLQAELPRMMVELRNACVELVQHDLSAHVQIAGFSAYMTLLHNCIGVSDCLSLELDENGQRAAAAGWGGTFQVKVPKEHMEVLYNHLNKLYLKITDAEVEDGFNAEGHRVKPGGIFPAPSQETTTSLRHIFLRTMQSMGKDPEADGITDKLTPADDLMMAVLASRQIAESQLEEIFSGPLAMLLVTQCEKARPKPLREVAVSLLKRHREEARQSEESGEHFYSLQQQAIEALFRCSGADAAASLSLALVKHWGPRLVPELERPLYVVLREAILCCVTPDRGRLPLLEAFMPWIKADFVRESRCTEIAEELRRQCAATGGDENMPHVGRMLRRLQHLPA